MDENQNPQEGELSLNQLVAGRISKMEKIREQGINPFPYRFTRTHTTAQATLQFDAYYCIFLHGLKARMSH
jgi:lysyl-tRNA synthetase class II